MGIGCFGSGVTVVRRTIIVIYILKNQCLPALGTRIFSFVCQSKSNYAFSLFVLHF